MPDHLQSSYCVQNYGTSRPNLTRQFEDVFLFDAQKILWKYRDGRGSSSVLLAVLPLLCS